MTDARRLVEEQPVGDGHPDDRPSPLHGESSSEASWSSVNLAEAVPGVLTPLCASMWVGASELGLRAPFRAMGVLRAADAGVPEETDERITNVFFGRMAVKVDFLCQMGDLVPGQSGPALARDVFGYVPPDYVSQPSMRRLPSIIAHYPRTLLGIARSVRKLRNETDTWWRDAVWQTSLLGLSEAQGRLRAATERFDRCIAAQAVAVACAIQPIHEQLGRLAEAHGVDTGSLTRGHGSHEETAVIEDLWKVSRGCLAESEFLAAHGYHGPAEGEVSSVVWREDPAPVKRLIARYRDMPADADPASASAVRAGERERAEHALLASVGLLGRLKARLLLRLTRAVVPLRGVGKVAYLQSLDVARASARRIGELLVADGRLVKADDAFYLTAAELCGPLPDSLRDLVAERRKLRASYQAFEIPACWTGHCELTPVDASASAEGGTLAGVGASPGVVTGRAVVVTDPAEADVDPGEILIAHTTDPSWASLLFLAEALVVDIGGMLSHAAVVAREINIPCVMNTGNGTTAVHNGDTIRVDGDEGTVEILERAEEKIN